ncbi:unnamed protein product [Rotaria sp. Silwood2]|nr:unnamed protein product [Rotaria sp. Silwood2]
MVQYIFQYRFQRQPHQASQKHKDSKCDDGTIFENNYGSSILQSKNNNGFKLSSKDHEPGVDKVLDTT